MAQQSSNLCSRVVLFFTLLISATACHKDHGVTPGGGGNPDPVATRVDSLSPTYFSFSTDGPTFTGVTGPVTIPDPAELAKTARIHLLYADTKVVRTSGGATLLGTTGTLTYGPRPSYDTLVYHGDSITITAKPIGATAVDANVRTVVVKNGLVQSYTTPTDTTYYYYDAGKLSHSEYLTATEDRKDVYTFTANNLTKIDGTAVKRADNSNAYTQQTEFSGYDSKANGLAGLASVPGIFLRSLSANNYTTVKGAKIYAPGNLSGGTAETYSSTFTIKYLVNGLPDYGN